MAIGLLSGVKNKNCFACFATTVKTVLKRRIYHYIIKKEH